MEDEIIEKCAVAVWSLWGKGITALEDTERSRTFSDAIKAIRALKK